MLRNVIKIQQKTTALKFNEQVKNLAQTSAVPRVSSEAQQSQSVKNYELQQEHIEEAIRAIPTLVNVSPEMWHNMHKTFLNHGLSTNSFLQIVSGNPKVLMRSPSKVIDTLEYWRSCQFGEYFLFQLITKYPFLLNIDDGNSLLKQFSFLQSYVSTSKNVWKLLMNSPTIIEQSIATIETKILYIKEIMRIEVPEMVKSKALEKSLDDIKHRHVFMERLGIFKPRSLKADPNTVSKNPRLYKITDTSEKTFATKVCHVSLAEYEAFKELYMRELKRIEEEGLDVENDVLSDEEK